MSETELDLARRIAAGTAQSPTQTPEFTWFAMRFSGTGTAWRGGDLQEHVIRPPEVFLSQDMLDRVAGVPLLWLHPPKGTVDSKVFERTVVGTVSFGYVAGADGIQDDAGSELWCMCRVYDADAVRILIKTPISTSPAVIFSPQDGNETTNLQDGTHILFESTPATLSHLACVPSGVWDKGAGPSGVRIDVTKDDPMPEETAEAKKAREDADNKLIERIDALVSKQLGDVRSRLDAIETFSPMADAQAKRDAEHAEWMKHDAAACARDDGEEQAEREAMEAAGTDKEVAADAARKARRDRVAKRRADAARTRSAADAETERKNETERADAQARADAVAAAFGEQSPPPLSGERAADYRVRLLRRFQKYSPQFKDADLHTIADAATFAGIESVVYSDAAKASSSPEVLNARATKRTRINPDTGHRVTEFFGPDSIFKTFSAPVMAVTAFNVSERRA
jgi:hypothetical protein